MSNISTGSHALVQAFDSWTPKAVVFDCDGVLLDTQAMWERVLAEFLRDRGATMDEELKRYLVGRAIPEVVTAVANAVGEDPHAVGHELGKRYYTLMAGKVPVLPGAAELLRAASARVPVAVASNTPRKALVDELRDAGLLPYIDHVVSIDDVREGKPSPDIYARAAYLLGAEPQECLAIEDSGTGATAARSAGLKLVVAPSIAGQDPEGDAKVTQIGDPGLRTWVESWPRTRTGVDAVDNPLGLVRHAQPEGVVFDCDGLLLDTESVWNHTLCTILANGGVNMDGALFAQLQGTSLEDAVVIVSGATGQDAEFVQAEAIRLYNEQLADGITLMPGAAELIELAQAKVPMAVASNSWQSALISKLEVAGIVHHFHNLQSASTVANGKPAPDMYIKAATTMGLEPANCVAFEDSALGARAAKDAGLTLVAVPPKEHPIDCADASVTSLASEELRAWVRSWPNRKKD